MALHDEGVDEELINQIIQDYIHDNSGATFPAVIVLNLNFRRMDWQYFWRGIII